MAETFDLVVIGSGTAAGRIAFKVREAGKSVAIVDSKPFGGTCALRGCDPKKVLIGAADLVDWSRRMQGHGITGQIQIDWPSLMRFKSTFTDPIPGARAKSYAEAGIQAIQGRATFLSESTLAVGDRTLQAANFAIAAGQKPQPLGVPGAEFVIDSEQFLELPCLPARIVFVGGGYIAFEFAHLSARAGSQVTILSEGPCLPGFDPDLVALLTKKTRAIGIHVETAARVSRIEKPPNGFFVRAGETSYAADLVVHAAGRVADISDLSLEIAGVLHSSKGVAVNSYLQSKTNPRVYAAGDCADTGHPALTPVAGWEGGLAAENILCPGSCPITPHTIPTVVFSIPPLARVGMLEDEAQPAGVAYDCCLQQVGKWYSSKRVAEDTSAAKVLTEIGSGRILGAHVLGHEADELINVFALAIRCKLTVSDLKDQIFSYPSRGAEIRYMV